jgi:hypothetical protein
MRHRFASRGCLPTKAFYRTSPYLLPIPIVSPGCGWEQITDFGSMGCVGFDTRHCRTGLDGLSLSPGWGRFFGSIRRVYSRITKRIT